MGVLDEVTQMEKQGIPRDQIIDTMRQRGISPKEVNDAFNQSQIKSAVADESGDEEMQPSIMGQNPPKPGQTAYMPQTQEMQDAYAQQGNGQQDYYPQEQNYYPQDAYGNYGAYAQTDTDLIIEVSEQVFSEKIKKLQKQTEAFNEFMTISQTKIDGMMDRLKRMETIIDKLQITILEKIGSYGQNLDSIKKEMSMMQDSFSKVISSPRTTHTIHKKTSKKK